MTDWRADQPYNDLPPLPPAAEMETRPVLKQCIAARAALAELKQAAELIPNQGVLINALPLLEAQASSEIENIVTTTDRLFQYQSAGEQADPATREALRHSSALLEGYRALKQTPLNPARRNRFAHASRASRCRSGAYRERHSPIRQPKK